MPIPARAHFVWIGAELPWAYAFAVQSAARRGGLDEVVLHHTDALAEGPVLEALRGTARVRLHRIVVEDCLAGCDARLGFGTALQALHRRLVSPVQRADLLRVALLHAQGGIYLDLDTVTAAPLTGLLGARQFIGTERIVWPGGVGRSGGPVGRARRLALDLARRGLRAAPGGWRGFRRIEHLYPACANNAVIGAEPGAPLLEAALRAMAAMPAEAAPAPYALGPHLFQALLATREFEGLEIHPPRHFYPLGPEISEHWFRIRPGAAAALPQLVGPQTPLVHWYGSVRTRARVAAIDPAYVRAHARDQLYSALLTASLTGPTL